MRRSDFAFDLPEDLIALHPAEPRSSARLLVQCGDATAFHTVQDLPDLLRPDDVLVLNDTKVIPARLSGRRLRGDADAAVELTLIAAQDGDADVWRALARPARKLAPGDTLRFGEILSASVLDRDGAEATLRFSYDTSTLMEALAEAGTMPLPPYIAQRRAPDETDDASYQTVFAKRDGAIAAPTASLHFDEDLVAALDAKGITRETVTLHVGIGTFLPVKADNIADHKMHAEWGEVTEEAAERLSAAKQAGRRIIPVGTTALRLLETAARTGSIKPFRGETDIFITPGFRFQAADALMTNFHLPESTLMMLVSAFMGTERMREVYQKAIAARFRFFSYGDSSLLIPASGDAAKNDSAVSRD